MSRIGLPYLNSFRDRYGQWRHYYRRNGLSIPIKGEAGTGPFLAEYQRVNAGFEMADTTKDAVGTFDHLVETYYAHNKFTKLGEATKKQYRWKIDPVRKKLGAYRLAGIDDQVIDRYIDKELSHQPATANNTLRVLGTLFAFAIKQKMMKTNPARGVDRVRDKSEGWEPWPLPALERFEEQAKGAPWIGFMLAFYTGQRQADVLSLAWSKISDNVIEVKQAKTGKEVWIPVHPVLAAALEKVKAEQRANVEDRTKRKLRVVTGLTIVQREDGQRYTKNGFGTVWQREQTRLGIKLPFHGLRKSAVIALLEAGCTTDEVKAVTGHTTDEMVAHYGKKVSQRKLAQAAIKKLIAGPDGNEK